jgi:hypothetical protein
MKIAPSGKVSINGKDDALENIRAYYLSGGEVDLPPHQHEIRKRLIAAQAMLLEAQPDAAIRLMLEDVFEVSDATARRDIKWAISLFKDVRQAEKEGYREIIYEFALRAFRLAEEQEDADAMTRAVKEMKEIRGLKNADPDMPDFSKLVLLPTMPVIAPSSQRMLDALLDAPGTTDLGKFMAAMPIETIDHEDVAE